MDSARSIDKANIKEATVIASLIAAAIEHPAYRNQSFGVVSLVGDEQALIIQQMLLRHIDPTEFESHRIVCGNPSQFQGDERDVMFLSLVDASEGKPLRLRQEKRFKQRFNVAASRAKNQMWVVYSLNPETDLKTGDLRRRLIEHATDPKAVVGDLNRIEGRAESELERQVLRRLIAARYRVTPQWEVGRYRIDMVIEGQACRLAVECDGDRYHDINQLPEDMERQAVLERLGWTFHRIRGSRFFRDPDRTMEQLFSRLPAMGIEPLADEPNDAAASPGTVLQSPRPQRHRGEQPHLLARSRSRQSKPVNPSPHTYARPSRD